MEWHNKKAWHPTGQQYKMELGPDGNLHPTPLNPPGIPRQHQDRSKYSPYKAERSKENARRADKNSAAYKSRNW